MQDTHTTTWSNLGPPAGFGGEYSTITGLKHGQILIQASQAEANLIAAAPEMLEALRKIDVACAAIPEGLEGYLQSLSDALSDARAAITKAKGGAA